MKYIGNFKDWLKSEWVEYTLANDGSPQPKYEFEQNDLLGAIERGERAEFCEFQQKY